MNLRTQCSGQSVVEVIIAMAIFSLISVAIITMIMGSFNALTRGGEETSAENFAQEGIEVVRAVKDRDWSSLNCINCVAQISGNEWVLSDGDSETIGKYTRTITLSDVYRDGNGDISDAGTLDKYTKLVNVEVGWEIRDGVTTSVQRTEYLTNWWYPSGGECLTVNTDNACFDETNSYKSLINITLTNSCDDDFVITGTTPSWDAEKNIENVTIGGIGRWAWDCDWNCFPTDRQTYGTELDFGDNILTISSGATVDIDKYKWNGNMSGSEVSLIFALNDNTTAEVASFYPPDCGSNDVESYCQGLGYSAGTCRANSNQCTSNEEVYEADGDQYCTGGSGEDTACCLPIGDVTPPSAVTNLALSDATTSSINLNWTAPGDDDNSGTAASYDVRYSTSNITEENWSSATQVLGEPTPSIAGSFESMTVSGLNSNTIYYFAIKTSDEVPNESGLSNVPSLKTLSVPIVIFYETFPNADSAWNGSADSAQDEPSWVAYQGNGDNDDVKISNEDAGSSPSGGNHLTFEDCDEGFQNPEYYDIAYVSIDLSAYTSVNIEYYWQSDDVDGSEGMRVAYSVNSTNRRNGTWTQIAEYLNPTDDVWTKATYILPDINAVSTFKLRFSSKSNATTEHMYVDDIKITATPK